MYAETPLEVYADTAGSAAFYAETGTLMVPGSALVSSENVRQHELCFNCNKTLSSMHMPFNSYLARFPGQLSVYNVCFYIFSLN